MLQHVDIGPHQLKASFPVGADEKERQFSLAYHHTLSKRTSVYGGFRKDNDEAVSNYGGVESRFGVGIKHTF